MGTLTRLPTAAGSVDSLWRLVTGDDVFVSYSRMDGSTYAAGVAAELTRRRLSCRVDQWGTEPGRELPPSLLKALRRATVLLVVGTSGGIRSEHVDQEIREFKKTGRRIVVVTFDGVRAADAIWAHEVEGLPPCLDAARALETGDASEGVINRIEKTFTFWRRDTRLRFSAAITALLLVGLLGANGWAARKTSRAVALAAGQEAATEAETRRTEALRSDAGWSDSLQRSVLLALEADRRLSQQGVAPAIAALQLRAGLDLLPRSTRHFAHQHAIENATLARDGRYVITYEDDKSIRVWDPETDRQLSRDIESTDEPVFDRRRALMAIVRGDGRLAVLALPTGTLLWSADRAQDYSSLRFSDDGVALAANVESKHRARNGERVVVWHAETGNVIASIPYQGHLAGLAISPSHDLLALSFAVTAPGRPVQDTRLQIRRLAGGHTPIVVETTVRSAGTQIGCDNSPSYLPLTDLSFSPDARLLAASSGYHATIRAVASLGEVTAIEGPDRDPNQVEGCNNVESIDRMQFAEDGRTVGTVGSDGTLQTWDALTGSNASNVGDAGYPPPGTCAVVGDGNGIDIIDVAIGHAVARIGTTTFRLGKPSSPFEGHKACDYSRGASLVAVFDRQDLWLIDRSSAQEDGGFSLQEKEGSFTGASADRRWVAVREGSRVTIWDSGKDLAITRVALDGEGFAEVPFSPNGSLLATITRRGTLQVRRTSTGAIVWSHKSLPVWAREDEDNEGWTVSRLYFSPRGSVLALELGEMRPDTAELWLFAAADGRAIARTSVASTLESPVTFADDDALAIIERARDTLLVIPTRPGGAARAIPLEEGGRRYAIAPRTGLIAVHQVNLVTLMDARTGRVRSSIHFGGANPKLTFSPSGTLLAILPQEAPTAAEVVDAATGRVIATIPATKTVWQSRFGPSERYLVTGGDRTGEDKKTGKTEIVISDLARNTHTVRTIDGELVDEIEFRPGERQVAVTVFQSSTVHLFDLPSGRPRADLTNEGLVSALRFSQDGKALAYQTDDAVHVWRAADWKEIARLMDPGGVKSVAFAGSASRLITVAQDGSRRRWVLPEEELRQRACERLGRNLSLFEWRYTFGAEPYTPTCPDLGVSVIPSRRQVTSGNQP